MLSLADILDPLARVYGEPTQPPPRTLLELVLFENIAYLVDDARRASAFSALKTRIGTRPEQILAAPDEALTLIAGHGILADHQVARLR